MQDFFGFAWINVCRSYWYLQRIAWVKCKSFDPAALCSGMTFVSFGMI